MQAESFTNAALSEIEVRPAERREEPCYKEQLAFSVKHYMAANKTK
jgi:hypothetical protein